MHYKQPSNDETLRCLAIAAMPSRFAHVSGIKSCTPQLLFAFVKNDMRFDNGMIAEHMFDFILRSKTSPHSIFIKWNHGLRHVLETSMTRN